jgi:hypothetical protein
MNSFTEAIEKVPHTQTREYYEAMSPSGMRKYLHEECSPTCARCALDRAKGDVERLAEALGALYACFDDEGELHEDHEDQVSIALDKSESALRAYQPEPAKDRP